MPSTLNLSSVGVSYRFTVTNEDLLLRYIQRVTKIPIDGVQPPLFGEGGGASLAMKFINEWFPWVDEKIVEPKYDGVCAYLGIPSNQPTFVKDYHYIALMRAADKALAPAYDAYFTAQVDGVVPYPQVPEDKQ